MPPDTLRSLIAQSLKTDICAMEMRTALGLLGGKGLELRISASLLRHYQLYWSERTGYCTIEPYYMCPRKEAQDEMCYDSTTTTQSPVILACAAPWTSSLGNTTALVCCATSRSILRPAQHTIASIQHAINRMVRRSRCLSCADRGQPFQWISSLGCRRLATDLEDGPTTLSLSSSIGIQKWRNI